jgi:hypothetical protein
VKAVWLPPPWQAITTRRCRFPLLPGAATADPLVRHHYT